MDVATKIQVKLKKILKRLKGLGIIKTFKLEMNFFPIKRNLIKSLIEIDSVLKKCLRKILSKPKRAEIRNVITKLVRTKNLNDLISEDQIVNKNICFQNYKNEDFAALAFKFQCKICNQFFSSKKNFLTHKKLHNNSEKYLCEKCGAVFLSRKEWLEHLKKYNAETKLCHSIKYFNYSQRNDKSHKESLEGILENIKDSSTNCQRPPENLCPTEKKGRNLIPNMDIENHLQKSSKEKKFTCACGKVFQIRKSLKKHEKLKHSFAVTKYNCPDCQKSFKEKGKLNRHMLSHKDSKYCCSVCSKVFARSDTLKRHLSICHYISEEFYCSFCQKKFKMKYNRDIHEENIHKNSNHWLQCEHCGKKLKNKITFRSHQKRHLKSRITCTQSNHLLGNATVEIT